MDFQINIVEHAQSTQALAQVAARGGAAAGYVVRALEQSAGRGRHGRVWESGVGNLACSIVLRPARADVGGLSLLAGLALAECFDGAVLKWPNDVLVDGKKCAGILLEADDGFVVLGLGVNVAFAPDGAARVSLPAEEVLERFLLGFKALYTIWDANGFDAVLRQRWLARSFDIGTQMNVKSSSGLVEGAFDGLADDGALLLRLADGSIKAVGSGELYVISD